MYFIEELKRIQKIHQLISCQCTGHLMNWQRPFVFHGVIYIISCMG